MTTAPHPVRPQDDLFRHVNGAWLATHQIPADRASDGAIRALVDLSEERVKAIIEACAAGEVTGEDATKIGALYRAFMDTAALEEAGVAPLAAEAAPLLAASSKDELAAQLGALAPLGVPGPFEYEVSGDPLAPDETTLWILQAGLGLPDESYYRDEEHAGLRAKYVEHLARMFELTVLPSASGASAAAAVLQVETELARGHWDRVRLRDMDATTNPMTGSAWEASTRFPLATYRTATGRPGDFERLNVMTPSYFTHLGEVWEALPLEHLRFWALARLVHARAPYLTASIAQADFDFYGTALTGATEMRERWKRGVSLVDGVLGEAVGRIFVARHFPAGHKAAMDELVANLMEAYRRSITGLEWMGEATRKNALQKLAGFVTKIGYPDKWRDYSALEVDGANLMNSVRAANRFENEWSMNKLAHPVDRTEWLMPPQMVNAYYMPTTNEIAFPAAILQPPFFDATGDEAANYGGIGAVIGHEIGHGFDDQGSKFDATGQLNPWWTDQDRAEFERRTGSLIDQYATLTPRQLEGTEHADRTVNGELTIGENIGDLGGLSIGLQAYQIALEKRGSTLEAEPVVDGYTALQRFFLNWARVWQEKRRQEESLRRLVNDPHSPPEFRCNQTARNIPEFHEAFGVAEGDGMWLDPAARVKIW